MNDRRRTWRTHTLTLGAVLVAMGMYAFQSFDTRFTATLAQIGVEYVWGVLMVVSGLALGVTGGASNRFVRWLGNFSASLVCSWTFWLCWQFEVITPTAVACLVIAVGCAITMLRDALMGKRFRCVMRETGRWERQNGG